MVEFVQRDKNRSNFVDQPDEPIGEWLLQQTNKSVSGSAARSILQQKETFADRDLSLSSEVPVGVLEIPLGIWGARRVETYQGLPGRLEVFSEETCTVIVFPHGAVIRLSMALEPGQTIMITNRKSGQQTFCRIVQVKKFPSVRGYAEVEFLQTINSFWGSYTPQGTIKIGKASLPSAKSEIPTANVSIPSPPAPSRASLGVYSAFRVNPQLTEPRPREHFYSGCLSPEQISDLATTTIAAPSPQISSRLNPEQLATSQIQVITRQAESSDKRPDLSLFQRVSKTWLNRIARAQGAIGKKYFPSGTIALVRAAAAILLICTTGILYLRFSTPTGPVAPEIAPAASNLDSQSPPPENISMLAVPLPRITTNEGFPGVHTRKFADYAPVFHSPASNSDSREKIPNVNLARPHWVVRSSAPVGDTMPPDIIALDPNSGTDAIGAILKGAHPVGGRVREPQLISKSLPIYPTAARIAGVEGSVTIEAVIDTSGKLSDVRIISGPLLLQRAALDSLRNWKYQPGYLDDRPVQVKTSIVVGFRLH